MLIFALSAATAATAARNDRDGGVRAAERIACTPDSSPKPDGGNGAENGQGNGNSGGNGNNGTNGNGGTGGNGNNGTNGNGGTGGNGNGGTGGNGSGDTQGNGQNTGNGNANGHGNANGNNGQGNGNGNNGNGNGHGNADGNNGRGNDGTGNNGNGNGNSGGQINGTPCLDPPADPAEGYVAGGGTLAPATVGESVNAERTAGAIRVKQPGAGSYEPLEAAAQLPEGTIIDAQAGTLVLTSATGQDAGQQTAAFTGAKFQVQQERGKSAVTNLVLRGGGDFTGCPRLDHGRRATQVRNGFIASRAGARRGLWGTGRGRFRTRGRWGSATVRGTVWHVEDRCGGTVTTVERGVVEVADFGLDRTVSVRAGESYYARVRR